MSNSHLPNSHANVTPTWRPYKFPRIPLGDAIKTSPVANSNGQRYSGSVPPDWCGNGGRRLAAHGGYCATVLMMAAQQYYQNQNGGQGNMKPLNMSVEYLEPLPQGQFEVALETLSIGKRTSTVEARLRSLEAHGDKVCTIAIVRLGMWKDEGHVTNIQPSAWLLPDRTRDCTRWSDANYYYMNPPASTVPPIFLNYAENGMEAASSWGIPTTALNIMFRSEVTPQDWLLTRTTMKRLYGGRFDMNIEILNEDGKLIASCVQICSVIPLGKPSPQITEKL
ncbi:hypothetical protein FANTH_14134 [Fusarium anthophilum]|uniref:Thioesterase domain-containing protein n=1 Tax=Fusarium anthophilum TaxID=48485 RepID=A0A8H4YK51_9HYPO|nr:hypothetical protein FANTH_14134 [Fusarium anthophilum]